ncbi:hypothetical protein JI752_009125 [Lysobacter sp. MMG2]|uniref:hypothetical protein n=1 Tax=Lysobacter sp. MMG2 TaxID=2801338 RepID=UPI001C224E85|nr:hypothetical protein [Lysobacter sp. MMG2]MBU8976297.1 hypothetical protein [Lysobacter sp. MMG2]
MNIKSLALAVALLSFSTAACAEVIDGAEVAQISAYPAYGAHYVWLSTGTSPECAASSSNPVLSFDESGTGGKGVLAMLTTALVNKRKVTVWTSGCAITQIYLK